MQNIDMIPNDSILFKFDLKMSKVDRNIIDKKDIEMIKNYLINTNKEIEEIFSFSPISRKQEDQILQKVINEFFSRKLLLKDMDYYHFFSSLPLSMEGLNRWEIIKEKIIVDVELLKSLNIMDYSLIITVAKLDNLENAESYERQLSINSFIEDYSDDSNFKKFHNFLYSPSKNYIYLIGIIDVLQLYDIEKKTELFCKNFCYRISIKEKEDEFSVKETTDYANRFKEKLDSIFKLIDIDLLQ